jgi:NAD+ synthase (glutamine-hydrolysing)
MIAVNGQVVAQGSQFSLNDVEVITATVDIEDVRSHRAKSSRSMQAAQAERYERIEAPISLSDPVFGVGLVDGRSLNGLVAKGVNVRYHRPEEEIA